MPDIGKLFGERLRKLRKDRGYTQDDVAQGIKEKRSTYAEWENGTEPKLSIVTEKWFMCEPVIIASLSN